MTKISRGLPRGDSFLLDFLVFLLLHCTCMSKFRFDKKYSTFGIIIFLILSVLLFVSLLKKPTPTTQTKAASNPSSINFLNQSVPIGKFVGLKNSKVAIDIADLIK